MQVAQGISELASVDFSPLKHEGGGGGKEK